MRLTNSLTGNIEEVVPIKSGKVGMYHCGPTVYDYVHIGNLRAFLTADLLRRAFEYEGFEVRQVMNITDVGIGGDNDEGEDKIIKGLKREGKVVTLEAMKGLTDFYTLKFVEDTSRLNILPPHVLPRASEHIAEDIALIEELEKKGFTYNTSDGVYFDTNKDPKYGKLGGTGGDESRIGENSEKRNQKDFALWKYNSSLGYLSPWGQGFPGWHIECSAMSTKHLGQPFDVHSGGIDLLPIHHNNEIAQSENACGCEYAHYWVHNGFVNLSNEKMAKSLGNILTLKSLEEHGFSPLAYRYFLLLSHYRTQTNFTWEALQAAQNAYRKLIELVVSLPTGGEINPTYKNEFAEAISNDMNTSEALGTVWKLAKDTEVSDVDKRATLLDFDRVLGLNLEHNEFKITEIPEEVQNLLNERELARSEKDFSKSDELRDSIRELGYAVEDKEGIQSLKKI
jgi:cysteinyl-tRNA synthetase